MSGRSHCYLKINPKKKKKKINPLLKQNSFEFQYISENKWSYLENLCLQIMQQDQATVKILKICNCLLTKDWVPMNYWTHLFLFYVLVFYYEAWGISAPQQEIKPASPDLEGEVLTTGPPVQFSCSVVSKCLWPHGLQHSRFPCPSPTPWVYPNSCPLSRWCHLTTSSSVVPFSCLQSCVMVQFSHPYMTTGKTIEWLDNLYWKSNVSAF